MEASGSLHPLGPRAPDERLFTEANSPSIDELRSKNLMASLLSNLCNLDYVYVALKLWPNFVEHLKKATI